MLRVRSLSAVAALALIVVASAYAGWAGSDPPSNYPIGTLPAACSSSPTGKACINYAVYVLDKARAKLHQPAYKLPADFVALPAADQLFILANLDRVQYGLPPMTGLTAQLNRDALVRGVEKGTDPSPSIGNVTWRSNWAAGWPNAVIAYEGWMWDDGLGSPNFECTRSNTSGCWGHRHNVLWKFSSGAPLAVGAAAGTGPTGGRGYAMLLVAGASTYKPTYSYTWSQAVADGAGTHNYDTGYCLVPNVVGKTLSASQSSLTQNHCNLGTVTRKNSSSAAGTVISQSLAAGTLHPTGTKVSLTVSLGP